MVLVIIDEKGRCAIDGAVAGAYDADFNPDGTVLLVPLVRATDRKPAETPKTVATRKRKRRSLGRDWSRVPAGTQLTGPPELGVVVMGRSGRLDSGQTPNEALLEVGLTRNAWKHLKLDDGRAAGDAYDEGEWPELS